MPKEKKEKGNDKRRTLEHQEGRKNTINQNMGVGRLGGSVGYLSDS